MDPELKKYLDEEVSIFPGIDLSSNERRDEPCWTRYADYSPGDPWADYSEEEIIVEPDPTN